MWDLAVREADYGAADSLLQRYRGPAPLSKRLLLAFAHGDSAARTATLSEARTADNRQPQIAATYLATYLEDLGAARTVARLSLAPERRTELRSGAHLALAWLAVAAGRWSAAKQDFAAAGRLDEVPARVNRALAATLPFLAPPVADLKAVRVEIQRWNPAADGPDANAAVGAALHPHLRLYLLGLLGSRLGDPVAALPLAAELDRLPAPPTVRLAARGLAQTVRADAAARLGRAEEALQVVGTLQGEVPLEFVNVPAYATVREYAQEHARYLRVELLTLFQRDADALRWLETAFEGAPNEYAYLAPLHYLAGEISERLGERQQAAEHYRRFIRLWEGCDPELRPRVEEAKARLAQLIREPR